MCVCYRKRKRKITRSRRGLPEEEEEEGEESGDQEGGVSKEDEEEKKAKEKARLDDLWASFKQDVAASHKKPTSTHSKAR